MTSTTKTATWSSHALRTTMANKVLEHAEVMPIFWRSYDYGLIDF
jgi:hypothetical protein